MKMPPPIATKFTKLVLTILAITILGIILSFISQDHTLLMLSAGVAVAGGVKIIVNHIMRRYQVDVPLRTQGWINDKLISVTIENGKCEHLRYSVPKVRSALKKSLIVCTS